MPPLDHDRCYHALASRDSRFDGWFYFGVTSTGIYCRPSCPARTPKRSNVRVFPTAAAAHAEGFRACRRCRPDAAPGSPEWNQRADTVARAVHLIGDGLVDREGVPGLARMLGYTDRHLHRLLTAELGTGPLALARAQRAHTARVLIETTDVSMTEIAFAAGFASIRQFNDTMRDVFAATPSELREQAHRRDRSAPGTSGSLTVRLAAREPFAGAGVLHFLADRAIPGVEAAGDGRYARVLDLPHQPGVVELAVDDRQVVATLQLGDLRDLTPAVARTRRLLDLDADAPAVAEHLRRDPALRPVVDATPGRRVPGAVDGAELALRAILGQQVSIAAARTLGARLSELVGTALPEPVVVLDGAAELTHCFPAADAVAGADDSVLARVGMPERRRATLRSVAAAVASGELVVEPGADRAAARRTLLALPGVGPWTAGYVAMRAMADPDAMPERDLVIDRAIDTLTGTTTATERLARAERWSPWRAYAALHLWASTASTEPPPPPETRRPPRQTRTRSTT